jgi:hypothetical protein
MKEEYTKDLEQNTKLSLKKRRTDNRKQKSTFKQDASIFKVKHKRTVNGLKKGAELQKRTTVELCPTSFITTTATRRWNGHFGKWRKKIHQSLGKKKRIRLYLWNWRCCSILYAEEKYDITKIL